MYAHQQPPVTLSAAALMLSSYRHTENTTRDEVLAAAKLREVPVTNGRVPYARIADLFFGVQALRAADQYVDAVRAELQTGASS